MSSGPLSLDTNCDFFSLFMVEPMERCSWLMEGYNCSVIYRCCIRRTVEEEKWRRIHDFVKFCLYLCDQYFLNKTVGTKVVVSVSIKDNMKRKKRFDLHCICITYFHCRGGNILRWSSLCHQISLFQFMGSTLIKMILRMPWYCLFSACKLQIKARWTKLIAGCYK